MNLRELTSKDETQIRSLLSTRLITLGVALSEQEKHNEFALKALMDLIQCGPGHGSVYGAFCDDPLMGLPSEEVLAGLIITVKSRAQPCYFIRKAYTRPGAELSTLSQLFSYAIHKHELLGYKRFYTMYRKQDIRTYHRLWRTSTVLKNYMAYTDIEYPPNIRPKHSDFWEILFGRVLYADTMVVRGFIRSDDTAVFN